VLPPHFGIAAAVGIGEAYVGPFAAMKQNEIIEFSAHGDMPNRVGHLVDKARIESIARAAADSVEDPVNKLFQRMEDGNARPMEKEELLLLPKRIENHWRTSRDRHVIVMDGQLSNLVQIPGHLDAFLCLLPEEAKDCLCILPKLASGSTEPSALP